VSDLVRFGVAMDRALLAEFDRRIAAQGYENRSEALRDLVRGDLTRAAWDSGALVVATITLVYDHHVRELVQRLTDLEHEHAGAQISSLHVHVDREKCLEVMVVRGSAGELTLLSGRLGGIKGVLSCELTVAAALGGTARGSSLDSLRGEPAVHASTLAAEGKPERGRR
jgi:CopG family nickel-responsive transcriptional regulator